VETIEQRAPSVAGVHVSLRCDVALIDGCLDAESLLALVGELLQRNPEMAIVLFTGSADPIAGAAEAVRVRVLSGGADPPRLAELSPREHEILGLLSEGLTGQAIARLLFLSPETVRTHVRNATRKLGAKTRVQAVALLVLSRSLGSAPAPVR
jgi:DNA-binding CsgD family transcriptional regulator